VQFLYALIAFVAYALCRGVYDEVTALEEFEIVLPSLADSDTEDLAGLVRDDALGFLGVALLLPAVVAPLFFCGFSTGLSATSTTITANAVPPSRNFFLPGR
jgi:hypothetical protein